MVVLDEADTMFDAGFGSEVRALLRPLRSKAQPASCVLVAATLSKVGGFPVSAGALELPQLALRRGLKQHALVEARMHKHALASELLGLKTRKQTTSRWH